ncbi:MAG: DMT family transporter [Halofilum sp. (in: g-proteobacteria)]|nr:DMT family transporter [Halofilum sp. (in: g-proteobacteria)]
MSSNANEAAHAGSSGRAYLLLTLTTLCWGANAVFGRLAVGEISPMLLVALRWLGTVSLLLVFASGHIRRDWPLLKRRLPFLAAMGALGFTAFNALFYVAAHSTTAVNIGIIQGSMPVFVLIGAFVAYRSPVTGLQSAGVVLTIAGVATVGTGGSLERLAHLAVNHGDLLMVVACMFYAGYAVGLRKRPAVSSLGLLTVLAAAAFVFSLPLVAAEAAMDRFQWPTPTGWLVAGLVTLLPSFLAQIFFIQGVTLIGPGRAGAFINLVPVFASILAVAILDEPFEAFHAVALGLVLAGIWLSERGGRS